MSDRGILTTSMGMYIPKCPETCTKNLEMCWFFTAISLLDEFDFFKVKLKIDEKFTIHNVTKLT